MYGDIHTLTIVTPTSYVYDDDGRSIVSTSETSVDDCRMDGGSRREVAQFAQRGISVDAVAHIPDDVSVPTATGYVDTTCLVVCDDSELHPSLRDTFRIIEVHPLVNQQVRLILTRTQAR